MNKARILIVEDDENKRGEIIGLIEQAVPFARLTVSGSYNSAVRCLESGRFDLIVLDMTMRTFDVTPEEDGGRLRGYGGRSIMRQMIRRKIAVPVVVITQFERFGEGDERKTIKELDSELKGEFADIYRGRIYYSTTVNSWKSELSSMVKAILDGAKDRKVTLDESPTRR